MILEGMVWGLYTLEGRWGVGYLGMVNDEMRTGLDFGSGSNENKSLRLLLAGLFIIVPPPPPPHLKQNSCFLGVCQ
jgi:hypothetical protein